MYLAPSFCNVFFNLATGLYIFFFTYNMGDAGLLSVMGSIGVATSMACMLMPILTSKLRKRDLFLLLTLLEIALRIGFYTTGYDSLIMVFGFLALIHAANVITNPLISAMLSETIEYAELKSGRRCAAIAFSGQTFTGKLAWAIAGGISGTLLIWLGYQPNAAQTQATMDGLFICISLVPILGSILRVMIMTRYNFTEDKHAKVRHALNKWRSISSL
ncbi:MFS transporter [Aeromonas sp. 602396]|uniref:MFS transporter n=1 Tax=Aeromonas sp. 602396 TaxID=2712042 RepID=UPI003BA3967C